MIYAIYFYFFTRITSWCNRKLAHKHPKHCYSNKMPKNKSSFFFPKKERLICFHVFRALILFLSLLECLKCIVKCT